MKISPKKEMLRYKLFNNKLLIRYDYPIHLIFGVMIPITTRYNVISEEFILYLLLKS